MAKNRVNAGRARSLTDAYRANIEDFTLGVAERTDLYRTTVTDLHQRFQANIAVNNLVFADFEDRLLSQMIPEQYYRDFTSSRKDALLKSIIVSTIKKFAAVMNEPSTFRRVVDDHMNSENIAILQERIMDILISQREEYYYRFATERTRDSGNKSNDRALIQKLTEEIQTKTKFKCKAEADRDKAISLVKELAMNAKKMQQEIESLKAQLKSLRVSTQAPPVPAQAHPAQPQLAPVQPQLASVQPQTTPVQKPSLQLQMQPQAQVQAQTPAQNTKPLLKFDLDTDSDSDGEKEAGSTGSSVVIDPADRIGSNLSNIDSINFDEW